LEHGETYQLRRGEHALGTVVVQDELCDFPWYGGTFQPAPPYAAVQALFDEELRLLEGDRMVSWEAAWARIEEPGLKLVSQSDGSEVVGLIIHIEGAKARWRF
jgi:hypothetical protein